MRFSVSRAKTFEVFPFPLPSFFKMALAEKQCSSVLNLALSASRTFLGVNLSFLGKDRKTSLAGP